MTRWEKACKTILKHEGGFVDDKNDAGGATKYGISLRFLSSLKFEEHLKFVDKNNNHKIDRFDIANLTVNDALCIYRDYWWNLYKYDKIDDDAVAILVFDMAVVMGPYPSHLLLQRAISHLFGIRVLEEDGILGSHTFRCVNLIIPDKLIVQYKIELKKYFKDIATNKPKYQKFLAGWLNRVDE